MSEINFSSIKPYLSIRNVILLAVFIFPIVMTLVVFFSEDTSQYTKMGNTVYRQQARLSGCKAESRIGDAGATYGEETRDGIKYSVRTPLNYDPLVAHPLLMVYAPAGANRAKSEKMTALTLQATTAGFIVAYADHPELSPTSTIELGTIPALIEKKWCVDAQRIFLTGHSDGGTVSMALAFMAGTQGIAAAIAPSAAGINQQALQGYSCPKPIPVMVMHSAKDRLFPGYGIESAGWWAACNKCDPIPDKLDNGCAVYSGCANGVATWYCEGDQPHSQWPGLNKNLLDFFTAVKGD